MAAHLGFGTRAVFRCWLPTLGCVPVINGCIVASPSRMRSPHKAVNEIHFVKSASRKALRGERGRLGQRQAFDNAVEPLTPFSLCRCVHGIRIV